MTGKNIYKHIYVSVFIFIIFTPLVSGFVQSAFNINLDEKIFGIKRLIGFTKKISDRVPFNFDNYTSSNYQKSFIEHYEKIIPFKKVLVKTYNTLQFVLFGEMNRSTDMILGKDGNILTKEYISAHLALGPENDFSSSKNLEDIKNFVDDLVLLQGKLSEVGKFLYVYIAPGKPTIQEESIPTKYLALHEDGRKDIVTAFDEIASKTNLNYWLAKNLKLESGYPPFYKTGIHWSRVYEQASSRKIIDDISEISKNHYDKIVLGQIHKQDKCFWRDCDMISLSNAWIDIPQEYFEYQVEKQDHQQHKQMKFLIFGDSFSLGLLRDISASSPDAKLYYTNRNNLFRYGRRKVFLKKDFNNVDYKRFLDNSDGVIIEMTEYEIKNYTYGFVKHLINILNKAE